MSGLLGRMSISTPLLRRTHLGFRRWKEERLNGDGSRAVNGRLKGLPTAKRAQAHVRKENGLVRVGGYITTIRYGHWHPLHRLAVY
jgi:hypothetical protein